MGNHYVPQKLLFFCFICKNAEWPTSPQQEVLLDGKKVHSLALTLPSLPSCLKDNFSFTMRECTLDFACEGDLVLQIKKYLVIPVFKDPLSNLIDLFLKTCLALS